MIPIDERLQNFEEILVQSRPQLLAQCIKFTGDISISEDLVQETIFQALKNRQTLRDGERTQQWLSGIARNICLQWARTDRNDYMRHVELSFANEQCEVSLMTQYDLEQELERKELIVLLESALTLLPLAMQRMLVDYYVNELPVAAIASRLGIRVSTATMRLQRSKLALHKILTTDLQQQIAPYLLPVRGARWEETRIWCPICGQHRFKGRINPNLQLKCPNCSPEPEMLFCNTEAVIWNSVKGYGRALKRIMNWISDYYGPVLDQPTIPCYVCRASTALQITRSDQAPDWWTKSTYELSHRCYACGRKSSTNLDALALCTAQLRQFWHEQQRIRLKSVQEFEANGQMTRLISFESLSSSEQTDVKIPLWYVQ